jgi:hypothetical protein
MLAAAAAATTCCAHLYGGWRAVGGSDLAGLKCQHVHGACYTQADRADSSQVVRARARKHTGHAAQSISMYIYTDIPCTMENR